MLLSILRNNIVYVKFRDLILYGLIGALSSSLDFGVYTVLVKCLSLNYLLANSISVVVGITTSFTLNRKYNFKVSDKTVRRFAIFMTVGLCGLVLSNLILFVCINTIHINELLSKLLSIALVVILQFLANKFITFKTNI